MDDRLPDAVRVIDVPCPGRGLTLPYAPPYYYKGPRFQGQAILPSDPSGLHLLVVPPPYDARAVSSYLNRALRAA